MRFSFISILIVQKCYHGEAITTSMLSILIIIPQTLIANLMAPSMIFMEYTLAFGHNADGPVAF